MKLISWNVNGVRAVLKKGFCEWLEQESPDILCLQETKAEESQVPDLLLKHPGYRSVWESGLRKGYSGVATLAKDHFELVSRDLSPAEKNSGFGSEGRMLVTKHHDFLLLNIYFPNGQKNEERLDYKLRFYETALNYFEELRKTTGLELVICGDFNTAHNEIDIARPKANENTSGFLRIERDWMDKLEQHGYIDTFRALYPDAKNAYTWWSMRTNARTGNVGWRLDYFYVSSGFQTRILRAEILSSVTGSDHCPILLEIALEK